MRHSFAQPEFVLKEWFSHLSIIVNNDRAPSNPQHGPTSRQVEDREVMAPDTVGELCSGVTGFATIFATGSHRFLLQVRNDEQEWDQSSTDKNGEFDLSLARVRYNFSLKYHRAL